MTASKNQQMLDKVHKLLLMSPAERMVALHQLPTAMVEEILTHCQVALRQAIEHEGREEDPWN